MSRLMVISGGVLMALGVVTLLVCGLAAYLMLALLEARLMLKKAPWLPQVPRDGAGRRLKERL